MAKKKQVMKKRGGGKTGGGNGGGGGGGGLLFGCKTVAGATAYAVTVGAAGQYTGPGNTTAGGNSIFDVSQSRSGVLLV